MKKILLIIGCGLLLPLIIMGQIASDNASNYGGGNPWGNGSTGGNGFGIWDLWTQVQAGGNAGFFLGSSTPDCGDVTTAGQAFGMFGNPNPGGSNVNQANAQRLFSTSLQDGNTFSCDFAIAFRNGFKGIDVFTEGFQLAFNFNVAGDQYIANGNILDWGYNQFSVFTLEVTQVDVNAILVQVTRGTDIYGPVEISTSSRVNAFKFYVGNTDPGVVQGNNIYFNNLEIRDFSPLPVNFVHFDANKSENQQVFLTWSYQATHDFDKLIVEHSTDSRQWTEIYQERSDELGVLPRQSSSTLHRSPVRGDNYYRLRAIGRSGDERVSPIRMVKIQRSSKIRLVNTLVDNALIVERAEAGNRTSLLVTDSRGKLVQSFELGADEGLQTFYLNHLVPGMYFLTILDDGQHEVLKFVKN